jgi:hypothetical protein
MVLAIVGAPIGGLLADRWRKRDVKARLNELNAMLNLDKRENEIVDGERGEEEPQKSSADRER